MARDIYTEPEDVDVVTLRNLGPLAPLAGVWEGQGLDTHPSPTAGITSAPFLHENFRTLEYAITVTVNDDGTLGYEQDTVLQIAGRPEPFHHTDRNTLRRVAGPTPNPAAAALLPARS
jgi:hypothetical protein